MDLPARMSPLSHDPLWPRTGAWPPFDDVPGDLDAALLGVPTWRTSLSPTGAHATPAAVRAALPRYSAALVGADPVDLGELLRIVDAGDIHEPDGPQGEERVRVRVAELRDRAGLVIALGGDNSATYPVAQASGAAGLITFDAHHDLRDGVSNGSPVRRLIDDGFDARRIVQVGIADFANSVAYARRAAEAGITVITIDEVRRRGIDDVVGESLEIAGAGAAASISTSMSTCAIGPSRPAVLLRYPADSPRGNCARSCAGSRRSCGSSAPTSSRSMRRPMPMMRARCGWPRSACSNCWPEGRDDDRTGARATREVGLGVAGARRSRATAELARATGRPCDGRAAGGDRLPP